MNINLQENQTVKKFENRLRINGVTATTLFLPLLEHGVLLRWPRPAVGVLHRSRVCPSVRPSVCHVSIVGWPDKRSV